MRILFNSVPVKEEWWKQTEYNYFVENYALKYPEHTFIYITPDINPDKGKILPNVQYVKAPKRFGNAYRFLEYFRVFPQVEDFVKPDSRVPIDLMITQYIPTIGTYKFISYPNYYNQVKGRILPIVAQDSFVMSSSIVGNSYYLASQAMGFNLSDVIILQDRNEELLAVDNVREFCKTDIMHKVVTHYPKLTMEESGTERKEDIILYGQKLNDQRRVHDVMTVLTDLSVVEGVEVYVTSQTEGKLFGPNVKAFKLDRDTYRDFLKRVKVSFSMSKTEGYPKGLVEQILSDVIVILPREEWAINLFGLYYPFYYSSAKDLKKRILFHVEHYEEEVGKLKPYQDKIRTESERDFLKDVLDKIDFKPYALAESFVAKNLYKIGDEFNFTRDLEKILPPEMQFMHFYTLFTSREVYLSLKQHGYTDRTTPDGELILFKNR